MEVGKQRLLWRAANNGNAAEVKALLEDRGCDVMWGNPDSFRNTALHTAAFQGNTEVMVLLLNDSRVDVNRRNTRGNTALNLATWNGQTDIVKVLLADRRVDPSIKSHSGGTPLWSGVHHGTMEIVRLLLVSDQDPCIEEPAGYMDWDDSLSYMTPLEVAERRNHFEIVRLLSRFISKPAKTKAELKRELGLAGSF